jgi:hypothetical protein
MLTLDPPSEAQWHHRAHSQGRSRANFRGADLIPLKRRQHRPMADGLHGKNLTQSETLCTWRRSLRGTWDCAGPAREGDKPHAEHVRG